MILYEDTRQKKGRHDNIRKYCDKNNIDLVRVKLDVGDYMIDLNGKVSVDTKTNLAELSKNLMNRQDHARFWKEVRRAKEQGIKLIVLCEHGGRINSVKSVSKWNSKYSNVTGRQLMEEIYRVHIAYGVEFMFCSKRSAGRRIVEILTNEIHNLSMAE